MNFHPFFKVGAAAIGLVLFGAVQASAADAVLPAPVAEPLPITQDEWQFSFTPYLFVPFIEGDVTARGRQVDVDTSLFEIIGDGLFTKPGVDSFWMSYAEARKGPTAFYLDTVWVDLGVAGDAFRQTNPLPNLTISTTVDAALSQEIAMVEGGVKHEIARWGEPAFATKDYIGGGSHTTLDAVLGARYWYFGTEINYAATVGFDFEAIGLTRTSTISGTASGSIDWVDPVVGLSLHHQIAPGKQIRLHGDIGGFGVGSDFSWQAGAFYEWAMDDHFGHGHQWDGVIGYRAISVDYATGTGSGAKGIDLLFHGPMIGASLKF